MRWLLVLAWQKRAKQLLPQARRTDIFGAMLLASELFRNAPNYQRKVVVIYSDMRHVNRELDMETSTTIRFDIALAKAERQKLIPDLKGVEVYVLGADAAGWRMLQWESLKHFWAMYFQKAEAEVRKYSVLRELPELTNRKGH